MKLTAAQRHALRVIAKGPAHGARDTSLTDATVNTRAAGALVAVDLAVKGPDRRYRLTETGRNSIGGSHLRLVHDADEGHSWILELTDREYISPNKRSHWKVRSRCNREWRHETFWVAKQQRIPRCQRIRVELVYWPPDEIRRDPDNLISGVLKPCVDGLVDAQVVVDDTAAYVDRRFPEIREPLADRTPTWHLIVTDLGDAS